jgi:hypothetical protein
MCRNITPLRGLEPPATADEIESAARQYVRKVSAASTPAVLRSPAFERAVAQVAAATAALLAELPPRRRPPATVPPLRRQRRAEGSLGRPRVGHPARRRPSGDGGPQGDRSFARLSVASVGSPPMRGEPVVPD